MFCVKCCLSERPFVGWKNAQGGGGGHLVQYGVGPEVQLDGVAVSVT